MVIKADTSQLSYGREAVYNIRAANTSRWFGIVAGSSLPDPEIDFNQMWAIGGDRDAFMNIERKHTMAGITIPIILQSGLILPFAFGKVTTTGTTAPFTHVIEGASNIPSMTIEANYPDANFVRYFTGCKVNSMKLSCSEGEELMCEIGLLASNVEKATTTIHTITPQKISPYMFHQCGLNFWGVSIGKATSFEYSMDNALKSQWYLNNTGSKTVGDIIEATRTHTISLSVVIDNAIYWDHLLAGGTFNGSAIFTRGVGDSIEMTFIDCVLKTAPHNIPDDRAEISVTLDILPRKVSITVIDSISGNLYG